MFRFDASRLTEPNAKELIALANQRISGLFPTTSHAHHPLPTRRAISGPSSGAYRRGGSSPRRPGESSGDVHVPELGGVRITG